MRLCSGCKHIADIVFTDPLDRAFCMECVGTQPAAREYLLAQWVANTIPYHVGDRVACRTGGTIYDGIGRVEHVSTDPRDLATPLVPMFLVALEEKAYEDVPDTVWYSEICLQMAEA
jgi:hypothetical protein